MAPEIGSVEEVQALLAAIIASSDDAMISKDLNGVVQSWNQSAERIFGYTAEEMIGKPITILFPPDRLEEEPKILEQLRRGQRVDHYEMAGYGTLRTLARMLGFNPAAQLLQSTLDEEKTADGIASQAMSVASAAWSYFDRQLSSGHSVGMPMK